jgi:hypothetical protein
MNGTHLFILRSSFTNVGINLWCQHTVQTNVVHGIVFPVQNNMTLCFLMEICCPDSK